MADNVDPAIAGTPAAGQRSLYDFDPNSVPLPDGGDLDDDPVVGEYDVYITPQADTTSSSASRRRAVYMLQFPNRSAALPYREGAPQAPLSVRVKPKAGFLEMDVTLPGGLYRDREKAVRWSQSLRDAGAEGITEFGMSAGFTSRVVSARSVGQDRSNFDREAEVQTLLEDFDNTERRKLVLEKQTLGGQILKNSSGRPFYMIGAFRNNTLHLSPLSGVVQLRPQFHYLDAGKKLESLRKRKEASGAGDGRQPRAIQQVVKGDDDGANSDDTRTFLQAAQEEPWVPLPFVGEDTSLAYEAYNEWLFVNDTASAQELQSVWTDDEYLDAISVPHFDPIARTRRKPLTKDEIKIIADERKD